MRWRHFNAHPWRLFYQSVKWGWWEWVIRQRTLIYFVRWSITVRLTSCLTGLDSAALLILNYIDLQVWLNPNQSNRRSVVQWYFHLRRKWVFSVLGLSIACVWCGKSILDSLIAVNKTFNRANANQFFCSKCNLVLFYFSLSHFCRDCKINGFFLVIIVRCPWPLSSFDALFRQHPRRHLSSVLLNYPGLLFHVFCHVAVHGAPNAVFVVRLTGRAEGL